MQSFGLYRRPIKSETLGVGLGHMCSQALQGTLMPTQVRDCWLRSLSRPDAMPSFLITKPFHPVLGEIAQVLSLKQLPQAYFSVFPTCTIFLE